MRHVAGMRIHGTIAARPAEVFAEFEAAALLPPPGEPYDVPVFARVKVHRDFHVEVGRSLYSAPKEYLGCHLDARADSALVKLYSPRAAGQGPSPPAAGPPVHRPRRPARGEDHLRDARRRLAG